MTQTVQARSRQLLENGVCYVTLRDMAVACLSEARTAPCNVTMWLALHGLFDRLSDLCEGPLPTERASAIRDSIAVLAEALSHGSLNPNECEEQLRSVRQLIAPRRT